MKGRMYGLKDGRKDGKAGLKIAYSNQKEYFFVEWRDMVRIGVINCAQQSSCNDFNIAGTPTIRIFYPGMTSGSLLI